MEAILQFLKRMKVAKDLHFFKIHVFPKERKKSNRIFGNISFVDMKSSNFVNYSNVFIQKNFTHNQIGHMK
jgi:hypothetical protein